MAHHPFNAAPDDKSGAAWIFDPHTATNTLRDAVLAEGLTWFGVAAAAHLEAEEAHLRQWLADGRHGTMAWLEREPERRADPRRVMEGCRSVVVLGLNYLRAESVGEGPPPPGYGVISKYARTRDYHRVLEGIGRRLARLIRERIAPGSEARFLVDYGPVMERAWAWRAGLGFIGKHTLLIHPREGSFHFLAVLLTSAELAPTQPIAQAPFDGCGDCRRCIDACPTGAITEPWKLDARRCLSYLTIETTAEVPEDLWPRFSGRVFGCDICQDVCPYNRTRAAAAAEPSPLGPVLFPGHVPLHELLLGGRDWGAANTPLRRAGSERLLASAAMAAVAHGTARELAALKTVMEDSRQPDAIRSLARRCASRLKLRLQPDDSSKESHHDGTDADIC